MSDAMRALSEWVWYGTSSGALTARRALTPLSHVFGAVASARSGNITPVVPPIPVVSIGNLTVGGTGKTPVASWFARELASRGARPALVLRGYGDDEWRVHQLLTPSIPVQVGADRLLSLNAAHAAGCDCAVLDDAFQHRRVARVADVVLVSADRWSGDVRLLPAGPYREPLRALARATAVIVTAKAATDERINALVAVLKRHAPGDAVRDAMVVMRLQPDAIVPVGDLAQRSVAQPLASLAGERIALVSAIADGDAFERQMRALGAEIAVHHRFPDHHDFTERDVTRVSSALHDAVRVVCTLKDAVKLGDLWPRAAPPLWYVSQTVVVERGAEVLAQQCDRVLVARPTAVPTAG